MSIIIAGNDTTAVTLTWFFYILCKNPLIQEIIAQVDEIIRPNNGDNIDDVAESPNEETLNKMHHLHAALTEILGLYPAVAAVIFRLTLQIKV